jgi:hypothetical protein
MFLHNGGIISKMMVQRYEIKSEQPSKETGKTLNLKIFV